MPATACRALLVALVACLPLALACAQDPVRTRYELNKRLQRLERALEDKRADKAAWARARPHLDKIADSFFGMAVDDAERVIDEALAAVTGAPHENELSVDGLLSLSCMGRLERAVVPHTTARAKLMAGRGYQVDTAELEGIRGYSDTHLVVYMADEWGDRGESKTNWGVSGVKFHFPALEVLVNRLSPGDYTITFRSDFTAMKDSGEPAWTRRRAADSPRRLIYRFSVVEDLEQKLKQLAGRTVREGSPVEIQITHLERTIRRLVDGEPVEADGSVDRMLTRALELAAVDETAANDPASILPEVTCGGDHWLMMSVAETQLPARLVLPEQLTDESVLVVALHGMGGNEHQFVDGLGDGLAGRLARERGWILFSPRATAKAAVLGDAVAQIRTAYDIPAGRICVIGYSAGTVKAIELAHVPNFGFLAMAAVGGGGLVRDPALFRGKPVHAFTGSADLAKGQSARLVKKLTEVRAVSELHTEPDINHLTVVQWWLPEIFRFFDEQAK